MARDIEEFLKRAAERRRQQKQQKQAGGGGAKPPQSQRPVSPPPQRAPSSPPPQAPPRRLVNEPVKAKVIEDPYENESVAEHVRKHITTDDVTHNAEHLGDEVAARDDKIDDRIHKTFDHKVGQLGHKGIGGRRESVQDQTTSVTQAEVNAIAASLAEMMQNPETVAQSIIVAEILKRPSFD